MSDATHVPQQQVDVGARTPSPPVGKDRASTSHTPVTKDIVDATERSGDSKASASVAASTSTSIAAERGDSVSETGPSTPSHRLTHPLSLESILHPTSSTAASSSKQSPSTSPPGRLPPPASSKPSKAKSKRSPKEASTSSQPPSAPILVNAPPEMQLPTSLSGVAGGSSSSRGHRSARSSRTHSPASSPDPSSFSFASIVEGLNSDPAVAADIDAIARICGRSRLSMANEYGAHRDPVGPGNVRVVGEDNIREEDAEALAMHQATAGLGVGLTGLPLGLGPGGLETVEETPATSESGRAIGSEGSPMIGGPEGVDEGNEGERWGLLGFWEGRSLDGEAGGSRDRPPVRSSRPTSGLSDVEFRSRAELEMVRGSGARENLLRLASVG